jgi:CBS domain-containing protein
MAIPTRARDVMTADPARCTVHATLDEVAALMIAHGRHEILVVDAADHPVGIITDRDIVRRVVAKGKNPLAYASVTCMSQPVVTAGPDATLDRVSQLMSDHRIRRVVIVDEAGRCAGLLSQEALQASGSIAGPRQNALPQSPR